MPCPALASAPYPKMPRERHADCGRVCDAVAQDLPLTTSVERIGVGQQTGCFVLFCFAYIHARTAKQKHRMTAMTRYKFWVEFERALQGTGTLTVIARSASQTLWILILGWL